mgnify:CR=1 FL=1
MPAVCSGYFHRFPFDGLGSLVNTFESDVEAALLLDLSVDSGPGLFYLILEEVDYRERSQF